MGIPTLISTCTASNTAICAFTSGIDSTYDEYMFVFTDIGPATDSAEFLFDTSTDGGSNYASTKTTTAFTASHAEDDSSTSLGYETSYDLAQATDGQQLVNSLGNGADESAAGVLHLFSPSSTTYVKHFYARMSYYHKSNFNFDFYIAGYINQTADIDAIKFYMDSGNFDGVIQMYGIA